MPASHVIACLLCPSREHHHHASFLYRRGERLSCNAKKSMASSSKIEGGGCHNSQLGLDLDSNALGLVFWRLDLCRNCIGENCTCLQKGALASLEEYHNEEDPLDYTMDIKDATLPRNLYGAQPKGKSYTAITLSLPPHLRC